VNLLKIYSIDEAFNLLKSYKITTNKESVRRWLRQGVIKGIPPSSRKEGWKIPKYALDEFVQRRLPGFITTNDVKGNNTTFVEKQIEESTRATMWVELVNKNIWEGYVEIKKTRLQECIQHRRYSKDFELTVWQRCVENSKAYSKPRVSYLLEAFGFEGKRILLDKNFVDLEEQVIFALIEYVRSNPR
jgi:hypothetical protein